MYYRRKILLHLITAFGEKGLEKLKLQKLLFLFCQEQEKPAFDFVPYKFGCFSFQAAKDLQVLETHYQLLQQDDKSWFITNPLECELNPDEKTLFKNLLEKFEDKTNGETVAHVYDNYPYYSIHSQWKMTSQQKEASTRERQKIQSKNNPCLFTLGYEGKSLDAYLNQLVQNNISLLCDVRKNPLSMKYGFSKNQLKRYCKHLGIAYEHLPELGIESQHRQNLDSQEDYQRLFEAYKTRLPNNQQALGKILDLVKKHNRIALTCFEKHPHECHRHCVSDYLQEQFGLESQHL